MSKEIKKILVIRFSSIGDIVLTSPVVRCLKKQLPGVKVHFCTKKQYAYLVDKNPYINKNHFLQDSFRELIIELKSENFDYIIDLHNNIRTFLIKLSLRVKSKRYNKLRLQRQLLASLNLSIPRPSHVVDRYMKTLENLGVNYDGNGLDFFIDEKDEIERDWLPETHRNGYVAFVMGGTAFTKILPIEKMTELCDKINRPIILIGGNEDFDKGEQLTKFFNKSNVSEPFEKGLKALNKKTQIFNGCGKFNIGQSAFIVKNANVVFSHDTGFAHISAAFKKTIFSIWGGTVPLYFYPYETKFYILENKELKCRPCSKNGRDSCPKKHFKCMVENPLDFYLPEL